MGDAGQTDLPAGRVRDRYLELLFRESCGVGWSTDRDLRLTHATGPALERANLDPSSILGVRIDQAAGGRAHAELVQRHRAALATGQAQRLTHDCGELCFDLRIEALNDESGPVGCVAVALDVTARVRASAEQKRAVERLEEAQRVAHVGSYEWDILADRVTASAELYRIYGVEPDQFEGTYEAFMRLVHPDDRDELRRLHFEWHRDVASFEHQHRLLRPDGAIRVLQTRGAVVPDDSGRPVRVMGSCWDITEREQARRAVEHSVSLLYAALEATSDGLLVVDLQGRVSACNQRFYDLWRIPPELRCGDDAELLGFVAHQLEDPGSFAAGVRALYDHPDRESSDVLRFRDGRVFERISRPQRIADEIVGRVWSFRDVTDRERLLRRAEFLADAARLLGSLDVETALAGVARLSVPFLGDASAVDLFSNGAPSRLVAVSREPTAPPPVLELNPSVLAGHPTLFSVGSVAHMGVPLVVNDAVVGAFTFCAGAGRRYEEGDLALAEELARRAALSVANARLFREAERALRSRDELLSVASHEIRGPLTSIHLAVQAFRRHPSAARADLPKLLEIIEREDRRLAQFVEELLDVGRIRAGRLHLELQRTDLAEVVRQVVSRLGPELGRCGSSLTVETKGPVVGQWDPFRVDQVVTNLLTNAMKFGLGRPIHVSVGPRGGAAVLTVADQGIGIEPEMQDRIFAPFERAVSVRNYGGLGLGLYIVKTLVEGMGGKVTVCSSPGAGAEFTVELPLEQET